MDCQLEMENQTQMRWNYLAGKIDKLSTDPNHNEQLTIDETMEFLKMWEKDQFEPDNMAWFHHVHSELNKGHQDILFK